MSDREVKTRQTCSATWPRDSSFLKFERCKQKADRICMDGEKRELFCEVHGRHKKLVAILPLKINGEVE